MHSAPEGKKIDLLKNNNKVCFEIEQIAELVKHDKPCKCATKYRSIIGYGEVEIISDYGEKKKGLDIIMLQYGEDSKLEYSEKLVDYLVILKLKITKLTGKQSSNWKDNKKKYRRFSFYYRKFSC